MRAIVLPRFGGPESLELREVERPSPGLGELLVRVVAAGTNPVDAKLRSDGTWARLELPAILGYDVSGVVEALGPCVTEWAVGDEVFYMAPIFGNARGGYAEYNAVSARIVARKPRSLTHEQAAAVPLAGGTAWDAIVRRMRVYLGETVLIHGGAGGVGSFAIQFAKVAGARVLATASAEHQDTLTELGADVAIDYHRDDWADLARRENDGRGVDAVFDVAGGNVAASLPVTRPFGRLANILPMSGDLSPAYMHNITLHGVFIYPERERLEAMTPLFERGKVRPLVAAVLPLERVREAHERLDSGHGRGKIVLSVGAPG
ncbi:zinc-dependent alcohol dehydrogenase family protein [Sorangium sp. So ce388]|uniref:zinc-dependent alcohol dehydrogenase family protein n=1 Tax=Sorangium sp. So ce388 TaxID=3133309 RepID=UPI003F5B324C